MDFFLDPLVVVTCCWVSTRVVSCVFLVVDSWFHSLGFGKGLVETCFVAPQVLCSVCVLCLVLGWQVLYASVPHIRSSVSPTAPVSLLVVCLDD